MATEYTQRGFGRSRDYRAGDAGVSSEQTPRPSELRQQPRRRLARRLDAEDLAQALGWFSIALGIAELAVPRAIGRAAGVADEPITSTLGLRSRALDLGTRARRLLPRTLALQSADTLQRAGPSSDAKQLMLRGAGARDLAAGVGILTQRNPTPWLWARVAGDVMDLALLTTGLRRGNTSRGRAAASLAAVAGITALDVYAAVQLTRRGDRADMGRGRRPFLADLAGQADIYIEKSIAINKPPDECYRFWRDLENLPRFTQHLEAVRRIDERRSHWVARGPAASKVEWDAEITEDRPGEALSWRTLDGAEVANAGSVHFEAAPGGRGTIVRVSLHYSPAGGRLAARLARLLGKKPQAHVKEDLRRFKQVLETGEIPTTRGQPTGRRSLFARATREWRLV